MRYALDDHAANKNFKTASFSLDILSSNERPGSRSRYPSRPMRGQYSLSILWPDSLENQDSSSDRLMQQASTT